MSESGQIRTSGRDRAKSALPSTADIARLPRVVRLGPEGDIKAHRAPFSTSELAEQALPGKKINSFEAFGEPVLNPLQQLDGLPLAALIGPQSGEIHRRPQLPGERALLVRQRRRLQKESGCRVRIVIDR